MSSLKPLVSPVEKEGRKIPTVPYSSFLVTAALTPVWATVFLPITLLYQVGRFAVRPLFKKLLPLPRIDSGYQVKPSQIVPRSDRKYDVVVLGATGFCGSLAVRHLARRYGVNQAVKWAIAGRSQGKLDSVKRDLAKELNMPEIESVDVIVVDTSVPSTMPALVKDTRTVASTAGPFSLYGSSVVEFCAKFGTNYVDITGEVGWVRGMVNHWQKTAVSTGAKLVSMCGKSSGRPENLNFGAISLPGILGNDSIPWDLSVYRLEELLRVECGDELESVSFWDQLVGSAPGGTFATLLLYVDGMYQDPKFDIDPFLKKPDDSLSDRLVHANLPYFIAKARSPWDDIHSTRWTSPFPLASINAEVVKWSHALRSTGSKRLEYKEWALNPDFKTAFSGWIGTIIFGSMLFNPVTRIIVEKFMIPKPGEGPSMEAMENDHFFCLYGEGLGVKGNRVESVMYFPKDPGGLETARMLVEAALCLSLQENDLPAKHGGFWTPATAMGDVLMRRLLASGTTLLARAVHKE